MPVIRGSGIISFVNTSNVTKQDNKELNHEVSLDWAENCAKQVENRRVPVWIMHSEEWEIGKVDKINLCKINFNNRAKHALMADFTIDNEAFIDLLQHSTKTRLSRLHKNKIVCSSDKFLSDVDQRNGDIDGTALFALRSRLPGLSIQHKEDNFEIHELSLCDAGKREGTIITEADFMRDMKGNEGDRSKMLDALMSISSISVADFPIFRKVTQDMKGLKILHQDCLSYSADRESPLNNTSPLLANMYNVETEFKPEHRSQLTMAQSESQFEEFTQPLYVKSSGKEKRARDIIDDSEFELYKKFKAHQERHSNMQHPGTTNDTRPYQAPALPPQNPHYHCTHPFEHRTSDSMNDGRGQPGLMSYDAVNTAVKRILQDEGFYKPGKTCQHEQQIPVQQVQASTPTPSSSVAGTAELQNTAILKQIADETKKSIESLGKTFQNENEKVLCTMKSDFDKVLSAVQNSETSKKKVLDDEQEQVQTSEEDLLPAQSQATPTVAVNNAETAKGRRTSSRGKTQTLEYRLTPKHKEAHKDESLFEHTLNIFKNHKKGWQGGQN